MRDKFEERQNLLNTSLAGVQGRARQELAEAIFSLERKGLELYEAISYIMSTWRLAHNRMMDP